MTKKSKIDVLGPNKDDLDILQREVGEGGYFGWIGTKKYAKAKAMLKAEIWLAQKNEPELKYKICVIYNIDDTTFKEFYLAGALYEGNGSLLTELVDKIREINTQSIISILNMFSNQSQA